MFRTIRTIFTVVITNPDDAETLSSYDVYVDGVLKASDINYYNGIAFKGFVEGVPTGVLSGGQYGNLMAKMGKKAKAIGFAVYMDELSRLQGK